MVNQNLFAGNKNPQTDATNDAGGAAYKLSIKEALAQFAVTGCFSNTFYVSDDSQLQRMLELCKEIDAEFLAKVAVYSSEKAWLKDMPAALLLSLSKKDITLFHKIFGRVIKNGKMLKAFFQLLRSGAFARKSLSYALQKEVQNWLLNASVEKLLDASIGNDPSIRDVLRCARPTPKNNEQSAVFNFLVDKKDPEKLDNLPDKVKALLKFRKDCDEQTQLEILSKYKFRWDLLSGDIISNKVWKEVAKGMSHHALRMNLNTLMRHEVFNSSEMINFVAKNLSNEKEILQAKQFPYQYLAAYKNCDPSTPISILRALETAVEVATKSVPRFKKSILIALDVSGSMRWSITGNRLNKNGKQVKPSSVRCVDVAALLASPIIRNNIDTIVVPFDQQVYIPNNKDLDKNILQLGDWLASFGGGGTNCSLALQYADKFFNTKKFDACLLISDNESWMDSNGRNFRGVTGLLSEWEKFKNNQKRMGNKNTKLICLDIVPALTTQAISREDILNVGGWNDSVFTVINNFINEKTNFVEEIEKVIL